MKCTVLLIFLTLAANAQSPVDKPSAKDETTVAKKVDPKLHADATRLVEVSGAKRRIQDNLEKMVDEAQKGAMDRVSDVLLSSGRNGKSDFSNGQTSTII